MERMPLQASRQIEPYDGESEGVRPAPRWGGWGSEPPDPGSALTRTIETHWYMSFAAPLIRTTYDPYPALTLISTFGN
jgi:hypothetical protein